MFENILRLFNDSNELNYYELIDAILFLIFIIAVAYLFIFAFKSIGKQRFLYSKARKKYRFCIIIPSYKEDKNILKSVSNILKQSYPRESYDIFVVSSQMDNNINTMLTNADIKTIHCKQNRSTKVDALQEAVNYIESEQLEYDIALVLDDDNAISDNYLDKINNAFYSGSPVVQTHRMAKSLKTSMSVLEALSEEINNSIFRKGHSRMGFSASLNGSGAAYEYPIFRDGIRSCSSKGEDKQMELYLLKNNIYIDYLDDVYTYDEKNKKESQFFNQRRRWIFSQIYNFFHGLRYLPIALLKKNWDYCDKLFQWMMPPRIILLGLIIIISLINTLINWHVSIKWWLLLFVFLFSFALSIPDYLVNKKLMKAVVKLPFLFVLMIIDSFGFLGGHKR